MPVVLGFQGTASYGRDVHDHGLLGLIYPTGI